jgi:hypothetical protein
MKPPPGDCRLDPRAAARVRVTVFGAGPGPSDLVMTTRNLSSSGALCESPVVIGLALQVTARLDLTDDSGAPHPVVVEALVVRVDGGGPFLVALHFVSPPARVLEILKRFVASALRDPAP